MTDRHLCEVFRTWWCTLAVHWTLALAVAFGLGLSASHLAVEDLLLVAALICTPIAWSLAHSLQWAACAWTITPDGFLIRRQGILLRRRERIHLRFVRDVRVEPVIESWGIGHVAFTAVDLEGRARNFELRWTARLPRLVQILEARGRLTIGRVPRKRRAVAGRSATARRDPVDVRGHFQAGDYGRFLAAGNRLLRAQSRAAALPDRVLADVEPRWLRILVEHGALRRVSDATGTHLRMGVGSVEDLARRVPAAEFQKAVARQEADSPRPLVCRGTSPRRAAAEP